MATYANLFVDQGADFATVVTLQDESTLDPLDLTDLILYGQVRRTYTSATAFDFVIAVNDLAKAEIKVSLPSSTNENMKPGRYVYDIFADNSTTGESFKLLQGILEIIPRVTRD